MSNDTPTQEFNAAPDAPVPAASSRRTLIILLSVGTGLLVLIALLLVNILRAPSDDEGLAANPSDTQSASPTPTESGSPEPTPTPTATPTPTGTASPAPSPDPTPLPTPSATATAGPLPIEIAKFISFVAPRLTTCVAGEAGIEEYVPVVAVAWNSTGAIEAWFAEGEEDAAELAEMQVPLQGDEGDFTEPQYFPCAELSHKYTLTLVAEDGAHVSKTWTVTNKGDRFEPEPR